MEREKERLKRLTKSQKMMICEEKKRNPGITQQALAQWALEQFSLKKAPTQATVSNILAKKYKYRSRRKRVSSTDEEGEEEGEEEEEEEEGEVEVLRFSTNGNEKQTISVEDELESAEREKERKMFRFKSEVSILQVEVRLLKYICKRKAFPSNNRLKKKARFYAKKIPFPLEDPLMFTPTWVKKFKAKYGLMKKEEEESYYLDLLVQ